MADPDPERFFLAGDVAAVAAIHLRLTIDHINPVSLGGDSSDDNLRTLCRSCNSRKGARPE